MHDSILDYRGFRYLWVALILSIGSIVAYLWHDPIGVPNGGSWLGYTLGTIGALLILWLLWFGVRKRRYSGATGSVRGWLSAHVYLGTTLILIAFLHAGFQVGWNIHTLALVLMLLVIFSGFFGVYAYLRYPAMMTRNRADSTRDAMLAEIRELDGQTLQLADKVDKSIHDAILSSIQHSQLGGGVWAQLTRRDDSAIALAKLKEAVLKSNGESKQSKSGQTMVMMVDFLANQANDTQSENLRRLIDLVSRKRALATRVARDIQLQALMEIWLYIHIPLSLGLLGALTAHVLSVFFYW
ncbi:MAG: hypothetical protein IPO66_13840 [Rhodanobacteraceae bacterium]|nr:hypothetical protein [Rhodanobacteraceae bacterium]